MDESISTISILGAQQNDSSNRHQYLQDEPLQGRMWGRDDNRENWVAIAEKHLWLLGKQQQAQCHDWHHDPKVAHPLVM